MHKKTIIRFPPLISITKRGVIYSNFKFFADDNNLKSGESCALGIQPEIKRTHLKATSLFKLRKVNRKTYLYKKKLTIESILQI